MTRFFRIIRKLILASLTCATILFAALWLLVTFAPFLGRSAPIRIKPVFVIANMPNGGWVGGMYKQSESIRWLVYVLPRDFLMVRHDASARTNRPDFRIGRYGLGREADFDILIFPYWFLVTAFGTYPALALLKGLLRRRRLRRNPNNCPTCGYNLTGNVSGTCPECGKTISGNTVPSSRPNAL